MAEIKTGGPAFPIECNIVNGFRQDEGITVRDYFAGQALAGICANSAWNDSFHQSVSDPSAKVAYAMADAMLAHKYATDPKPPALDDDRPF
jgi:hypothetical protein